VRQRDDVEERVADGIDFIAMEFVLGRTLGRVIPRHSIVRVTVATPVVARWEGALDVARARAVLDTGFVREFGSLDDEVRPVSVAAVVASFNDRDVSQSIAESPNQLG